VLSGLAGALLGLRKNAFQAACEAVYWHGWQAEQWGRHSPHTHLTALQLAQQL
jgi:NAD(P)H-hydrate repair Nnr-like enzyme with NAD(P)H-hydrate dehydratase domain